MNVNLIKHYTQPKATTTVVHGAAQRHQIINAVQPQWKRSAWNGDWRPNNFPLTLEGSDLIDVLLYPTAANTCWLKNRKNGE
jgi:hypothetical protein